MICLNLRCEKSCDGSNPCGTARQRKGRFQEIMAEERNRENPVEGSWKDLENRAGDLLYEEGRGGNN